MPPKQSPPSASPAQQSSPQQSISVEKIQEQVSDGRMWVILFGGVYDLTNFAPNHPGGIDILQEWKGRDATDKFVEVSHLKAVNVINILAKMRVGKFQQQRNPKSKL